MSSRAIPSEQRIFSLVLALVARPEGSTRHELLSSVYGYENRYVIGEPNPSLERQFERDKEQLRALGIRVETLDSPSEPGNNQLTRYRISKELLEFPSGLRFSERELMLLRLAALSWSEGSLTAESRRSVMKLRALGAGFDVRQIGVAPVLGAVEPAAAPLQRAIDAGRVVTFDYTIPDRTVPHERRVAPLRLHRAEGRWHLIGWDLERDAGRVFLLSRIHSEVRLTATRFDADLREHAEDLVDGLLGQSERHLALLSVTPGSVAQARLTARDVAGRTGDADPAQLRVRTLDLHELAAELASYGGDVVVHEPPELRALVIDRLRRIAQAHLPEPAEQGAHD